MRKARSVCNCTLKNRVLNQNLPPRPPTLPRHISVVRSTNLNRSRAISIECEESVQRAKGPLHENRDHVLSHLRWQWRCRHRTRTGTRAAWSRSSLHFLCSAHSSDRAASQHSLSRGRSFPLSPLRLSAVRFSTSIAHGGSIGTV